MHYSPQGGLAVVKQRPQCAPALWALVRYIAFAIFRTSQPWNQSRCYAAHFSPPHSLEIIEITCVFTCVRPLVPFRVYMYMYTRGMKKKKKKPPKCVSVRNHPSMSQKCLDRALISAILRTMRERDVGLAVHCFGVMFFFWKYTIFFC